VKRIYRILIEFLAPPLLGIIPFFISAGGGTGDTFQDAVSGFFKLTIIAYIACIIPATIYAVAMEIWFRKGPCLRYGLVGTICFSTILGLGAGVLLMGFRPAGDEWFFPKSGAWVGFTIGYFLGRTYRSNHEKSKKP
jgi:hypothetical protein